MNRALTPLVLLAFPLACAPAAAPPTAPLAAQREPTATTDVRTPSTTNTAPSPNSPPSDAGPKGDAPDAWTDRYTGQFDFGAWGREYERIVQMIRDTCPLPAHPGRSSVKVEFAPEDGHVRKVWFEYSPFPDTPSGDCVLRAVSTAHVPPFPGPPFRTGGDFVVGADPGGNATFGNFDHRAAAAAMDSAVASARSCLPRGAKPVQVKVVVSRSGEVKEVAVGPGAPNPDCLRSALGTLRVPPYVGLDVTFERVIVSPKGKP